MEPTPQLPTPVRAAPDLARHPRTRRFSDRPRRQGPVETVAELVSDTVVVFGSLPPRGRDLDLLVHPRQAAELAAGLPRAGFVNKGRVWARFANCDVEAIELIPAASWDLPQPEILEIFRSALPISDTGHVRRPAAHHRLLILARRLGLAPGRLEDRRRDEIAGALAEDPGAWEKAGAKAHMWDAERQLDGLMARWRDATNETTVTNHRSESGIPPLARSAARFARRTARARRHPGMLVALSGLDGCGKSTQAECLERALTRLGADNHVEWTSIVNQPAAVTRLKQLANFVLRAAVRLRGASDRSKGSDSSDPASAPDPAHSLRKQSGLVSFAWVLLQGAITAGRQRRMALRHIRQGRIVVCDRYTLDALVHVRFAYPEANWGRFHALLMRLIPPPATLSFFLDVDAAVATERKQDYTLAENEKRARLYRELAPRQGAIRIDGEEPPDVIAATIARDVWIHSQ